MARLHSTWGLGAWCAATNQNQPYLQVDLSFDHKILKVESQGRKDESAWVKSFTLSYREKDKNWQNYTEGSNHVKVQMLTSKRSFLTDFNQRFSCQQSLSRCHIFSPNLRVKIRHRERLYHQGNDLMIFQSIVFELSFMLHNDLR